MSADWKHHIVTVEVLTDIREEAHVKFSCSAPEDGPCRTYPAPAVGPTWEGCTCDVFFVCDDHMPADDGGCGRRSDAPVHDNAGHVFVPGQECWVKSWFDGGSHTYVGLDSDDTASDNPVPAIARTGEIDVFFDGDVVEWQWHYPFQGAAS
jgi:hypothetical protein